jgi:TatD DNase family protein
MRLVDVHAHLDFPVFDADLDGVLRRAEAAGVLTITSALGLEGINKTLRLLERYVSLKATFGLAPTEFSQKAVEETIRLIRENRQSIVGIGEVGLDYYWVKDQEKRELEKANFRSFIGLAKELRLPLVIHSRDAEADVLKILEENDVRALLHCFSGSVESALDAAAAGHLISIPTSVVHSKGKQKLSEALPLESMVLETDSPYLPPTPKTRNEPANIAASCEKIARLRDISPDTVASATTENAARFFDLKSNKT